jgi:hypothetical protein
MLLMQRYKVHVVVADDVAAPLLDRNVIVPPIKRVEVRSSRESKLEAHLRVAHGVAVLQSVVHHRNDR